MLQSIIRRRRRRRRRRPWPGARILGRQRTPPGGYTSGLASEPQDEEVGGIVPLVCSSVALHALAAAGAQRQRSCGQCVGVVIRFLGSSADTPATALGIGSGPSVTGPGGGRGAGGASGPPGSIRRVGVVAWQGCLPASALVVVVVVVVVNARERHVGVTAAGTAAAACIEYSVPAGCPALPCPALRCARSDGRARRSSQYPPLRNGVSCLLPSPAIFSANTLVWLQPKSQAPPPGFAPRNFPWRACGLR